MRKSLVKKSFTTVSFLRNVLWKFLSRNRTTFGTVPLLRNFVRKSFGKEKRFTMVLFLRTFAKKPSGKKGFTTSSFLRNIVRNSLCKEESFTTAHLLRNFAKKSPGNNESFNTVLFLRNFARSFYHDPVLDFLWKVLERERKFWHCPITKNSERKSVLSFLPSLCYETLQEILPLKKGFTTVPFLRCFLWKFLGRKTKFWHCPFTKLFERKSLLKNESFATVPLLRNFARMLLC